MSNETTENVRAEQKDWGTKEEHKNDENSAYSKRNEENPQKEAESRWGSKKEKEESTGWGWKGDDEKQADSGRREGSWNARGDEERQGFRRERRFNDQKDEEPPRRQNHERWGREGYSDSPRKRRIYEDYTESRNRGFNAEEERYGEQGYERRAPRRNVEYGREEPYGRPRRDFQRPPYEGEYRRRDEFSRSENQRGAQRVPYAGNASWSEYDDRRQGEFRGYGRGMDDRYGYNDRPYRRDREDQQFNQDGYQRMGYKRLRKRSIPVNPPPSKVIGLFGLSVSATIEDVKDFLAQNVTDIKYDDVHLVKDKITGSSRGFAFVYFASLDEAISAKEALVGKSMGDKEVRVDYSISEGPRPSKFEGAQ